MLLLASPLLGPVGPVGGWKGLEVKWSEVDAGYMGHLLRNCSLLIFLAAAAAATAARRAQ